MAICSRPSLHNWVMLNAVYFTDSKFNGAISFIYGCLLCGKTKNVIKKAPSNE